MTVNPIERWPGLCGLAVLVWLASLGGAIAGTVSTGWRVGEHGAVTRFVLDLAGPVIFNLAPEGNPDRLRIDLPEIDWKFGHDPGGARPDGLVRAAEFSDPQGGISHILLWLTGPARVSAAYLVPPSEGYRYRLVIDLESSTAATPAPAAAPPPKPAPPRPVSLPPPAPAPTPAPAPVARPEPARPPPAAAAPALPMRPADLPAPLAVTAPTRPEPPAPVAPPLALRPNRMPADPVPAPPPSPPTQTASVAALPAASPGIQSPDRGEAPVPARAPQPRITTTPLANPNPPPAQPPRAEAPPDQPPAATEAPPPAKEEATDAVATPAGLPPPRIIRIPGHPVMVILAIPPRAPPAPVETKPVIIIDPGHGGVDPGATGFSGVREKIVTLAMAEELQRQLAATGRYRVHLTRADDSTLPLRERVRIARADHADLFLSIHADVLANRSIGGLSVYTQSDTASDREAEALAAKENKADLIAGLDLSGEKPEITNILIDLAQRETRNRSVLFAGELVHELGMITPLLVHAHRFAGFAVLTAPDIPSVLIELGYLSNRDDERGLTSPEQRARLAAGLLRAIDRFFANDALLRRS